MADLLRMVGFAVTREQVIGSKKVDLVAEERRFGVVRRIAVECKGGAQVLTRKEVAVILAEYQPLYEARLVDEVLLVTASELAPSAVAYVRESRVLAHQTLQELQSSLIDFDVYVADVSKSYETSSLADLYVPVRDAAGQSLEEKILAWVAAPEGAPVAILGSYGIGKTTFVSRLAYVLAESYRATPLARIPIVIKLGEISAEQTLEGLLGKAFTSTSIVRQFSFPAFMMLNRLGKLVVFLDGFDEMKHNLSWETFRYNFSQLNRLVEGNARVLVLGRPTAFLSDMEYRYALHGMRRIGDREVRDESWPAFRIEELAPFDSDQIEEFLRKYAASIPAREAGAYEVLLDALGRKRDRAYLLDLARRPVQLRMLADVLPQWHGDLTDLTVTLLYDNFIDLVIEREHEKMVRQGRTARERRRFARELGWWLWEKRQAEVVPADIPEALFAPYVAEGHLSEGVRRDLVSACFLERKLGGALFFPHRSFQEFLVAEELVERIGREEVDLGQADALATEEIRMFAGGMVNVTTLQMWERGLVRYKGSLSWRFASLWFDEAPRLEFVVGRVRGSKDDVPWYLLFAICAHMRGRTSGERLDQLTEICRARLVAWDGKVTFYLFCAILVLAMRYPNDAKRLGVELIRLLSEIAESESASPYWRWRDVLRETLSVDRASSGKPAEFSLDLSRLFTSGARGLTEYCFVSDWMKKKDWEKEAVLSLDDVRIPRRVGDFRRADYPELVEHLGDSGAPWRQRLRS